jgi:acetyltransferase-like isoleucine patch superfamily enzyme
VPAGTDARVGSTIGVVAATAERPTVEPAHPSEAAGDQIVTSGAQALLAQHGLSVDVFAGLDVVRTSDIEGYLRGRDQVEANAPARHFLGELLSPDADWDAVLTDELYQDLMELVTRLRKRMKARFNRHVSVGDLLHDRWQLAREYGFGEGTNVYDDCFILGDVVLGERCWVGPHCVLDGSGGLVVGDFVDVGAGSHLYSHNTIERALTGHKQPIFYKSTRIGSRCFIGPNSIIAPGTVLGDGCFVAAGSYVEGVFPDHSYIGGSPASILGTVEVTGDRARVRPFEKE